MKKIVSFFLAVLMSFTLISAAYADSVSNAYVETSKESTIQPRAEETTWYLRNNNGVWEKRLWSITYGKWLTDWIPAY